MTEIEQAIQVRNKRASVVKGVLSLSILAFTLLVTMTWIRFEELVAAQRTVYPIANTIGSATNVAFTFLLVVINSVFFFRLRQARENVALKAFLLLTRRELEHVLPPQRRFVSGFLQAADLPPNYSLSLLTKMNMRHFMTHAKAINKNVNAYTREWVKLGRTLAN